MKCIETLLRQVPETEILSSMSVINATQETNGRNPESRRSAQFTGYWLDKFEQLSNGDDVSSWQFALNFCQSEIGQGVDWFDFTGCLHVVFSFVSVSGH